MSLPVRHRLPGPWRGVFARVHYVRGTVYIDYSDVEKPNGERATSPSPTAGANIVVLSADPVLIDLLRDSLAGSHRVWRADDATHAADLIVAAGNAVLLADSSLADHDTRELVTRVHEQFPDLAIIVAGRRDDEAQLADLVSQGTIFRFLHKPASADRIRNFVDATLRRQQQKGLDMPAALFYDDPKVFARPWTMAFGWRRNTEPGFEILESACWEGIQEGQRRLQNELKEYRGGFAP